MFDFGNLDGVDRNEETPEWKKWKLEPSAGRRPKAKLVDLEEEREEQFAAADAEEYVFEKLEVPLLPEEGAWDPMGFMADAPDEVEDRLAAYNGQVVMNYVTSSYEQHMIQEYQKEERRSYLAAVHEHRLAELPQPKAEPPQVQNAQNLNWDRKPFQWRVLMTPFVSIDSVGLPDGGHFSEVPMTGEKFLAPLYKMRNCAFVTPATMMQAVMTLAHKVVPAPSGPRIARGSPWRLVLTDCFFPSPFCVDSGSEFIGNTDNPTFVHLVAISIAKETGEIGAKKMLENIKITGSTKYPKRR